MRAATSTPEMWSQRNPAPKLDLGTRGQRVASQRLEHARELHVRPQQRHIGHSTRARDPPAGVSTSGTPTTPLKRGTPTARSPCGPPSAR
jgi:hypothetical protein